MRNVVSFLRNLSVPTVLIVVSLPLAGCDAAENKAKDDAVADDSAKEPEKAAANRGADEGEDASPAKANEGAAPGVDPNGPSLDGTVSFSLDGEAKTFEYIPSKSSMVSSFNTGFQAKPEGGSEERLSITLTSFDPSKAELPATLSFDVEKMAKSGKPQKLAKAPKPMVTYTSPDGDDFRNHVTVHVASWSDGLMTGTIEDVTLSAPSDTGAGSVELSNTKFSVKLR